jgi:hypothetical protein
MSVSTSFHPRKLIFTSQNKHCVTFKNDRIEKIHECGNPKCKSCLFISVEVMPTPQPIFSEIQGWMQCDDVSLLD